MLYRDEFPWINTGNLPWSVRWTLKDRLRKWRNKLHNWRDEWNIERVCLGLDPIDINHSSVYNRISERYQLLTLHELKNDPDSHPSWREFRAWATTKEKHRSRRWSRPAKERTKYVRNPEHEKKSKREKSIKREKKEKYFRKDNRRNWNNGPRQFWVTASAKKHRQWVRQQLAHENWDAFYGREYKYFADPWYWD